ncbi:MAG: hypothetical protein AAFZ89_12180 [Bacteroidota bacterium]
MESHVELSDTEFEYQFSNCNLEPALFTHQAHLRLAWIHIQKYGLRVAIENMCTQIANYTDSLGASDKFNKTVTIAATKAVYHFVQKSNTANFDGFIKEFPRLQHNFKDLMKAHYKIDIFTLERAKRIFLEPDLLPFT